MSKQFQKPFWLDDDGTVYVEWPMTTKEYLQKYGNLSGPISFFSGLFFARVGNFIRSNKEKVKRVIHRNLDMTYIPYVAWLTKVTADKEGVEVKFENIRQQNTKKRKVLGCWDKLIDTSKLLEVVSGMNAQELRELSEIFASANLHLSDVMYQIDFGTTLGDSSLMLKPTTEVTDRPAITNRMSTWQCYGRYSLRLAREKFVNEYKPQHDEVVLIPCTSSKPYYASVSPRNEHAQMILKFLREHPNVDKVVMTTIGVVPEQFWEDPIDLGYDTGVPDLWADYLSLKKLFTKHGDRWKKVYCFLNYGPYLEMVEILKALGVIKGEVIYMVDRKLKNRKGRFGPFFHIKQG